MGRARIKNRAADRFYAPWLTLRYGSRGARLKALACLIFGHLHVRFMSHEEVCETPWDDAHLERYGDKVESFCMHCDSGWFETPQRGFVSRLWGRITRRHDPYADLKGTT